MEIERVLEVFVPGRSDGGQIGSAYRLGGQLVVTAGHLVADLPTHPVGAPVRDDVSAPVVCQVRPPGVQYWTPAVVAWRDPKADVAILRLAPAALPLPEASSTPRWGQVEGQEPIAVCSVGFPWAQERPDRVRDSEHLFGFVAPATHLKAGHMAVTVLTSAPAARHGGSPWAGMSGAALFAGPFLVGVVVVDPDRFAPDRVVAFPLAPLLAHPTLRALLGDPPLAGVGPRPRLAISAHTSVALAPPYRAPSGRLGREPSRLLLPEYGIVPFLGRETELQELQDWCLNGDGAALRVLQGAGGSGKTRLAAEACVRLIGHGWQAGTANPAIPGTSGDRPVLAFDRPTLLVVDDADLNVDLLEKLVQSMGFWPPDAPPVRLLLIARQRADWWDTLVRRTRRLAAEMADIPIRLVEGELPLSQRTAHHIAAARSFRLLIDDPRPTAAIPNLADDAFSNPLLVHMHALLAVTGADISSHEASGDASPREAILAGVLEREEALWEETFPAHVPLSDEIGARRQVVGLATLFAPPDRSAASRILTSADDLADTSIVQRRSVADWLRQRYPGSTPPWAAPLRPDLLAEQLLATCPDLLALVLAGHRPVGGDRILDAAQTEQLLAELTRAACRATVREALDRLLDSRLSDLLEGAIAAPTGRLPDILNRALITCPQPESAAALTNRLPQDSTGLSGLAATMSAQAVDHHRALLAVAAEARTPDLAMSLNNLSNRLADLGKAEDALTTAQEATTLYRALVAAHPDAHTPNLANSLNNLSIRLAHLGKAEDALTAAQEATTLNRALATTHPDAYSHNLASSLNNLSIRLSSLGQAEDALTAIRESIALQRTLATARPDAYAPALANSLNNLAVQLGALGQVEDALTAIEECIALRRAMTNARPDAYAPGLAGSLNNLAVQLAGIGQSEDALTAAQEATTLYRALATAHPDAHATDLASSLNNLSIRLAHLGQAENALTAAQEATTLYRAMATARPDAYIPDLASSLNNLSIRLFDIGQAENALTAVQEAAILYRAMATARPDTYTPDLATSLNNLSSQLASLGQDEDALTAIEEAVALRRAMAVARPDAHTPLLAASLNNLGIQLAHFGRAEDALTASQEATTLYRALATTRPNVHTPGLATSLHNLSSRLADLGRAHDALTASQEATILYQALATTRPNAHTPGLAASLHNLSSRLADVGRAHDALAAIQQAVRLRRALATTRPDAHTADLAYSLRVCGAALNAIHRDRDALAVGREAVALLRNLHERHPDRYRSQLASALTKLAIDLRQVGDEREAQTIEDEWTSLPD